MRLLAVVCALMFLVSACGDDTGGADAPATDPPTTEVLMDAPTSAGPTTTDPSTRDPTTTVFQVDDEGSPSPASIAADREFRTVVPTHANCGSIITTSGWPTTAPPRPDATECIVAAAATGDPAQYSVTGRDFQGGMAGVTFRVDGPDDIVRIDYSVAPDGTVTTDETPCTALSEPSPFDAVPVCRD